MTELQNLLGEHFALIRNSRSCGFVLKLLDFASKNLPNNGKYELTFILKARYTKDNNYNDNSKDIVVKKVPNLKVH